MGRDILSAFELQVLEAIEKTQANAYGAALLDTLESQSGKPVSVGALYSALERLTKKRFLSSVWGEATIERGGRKKKYYRLEALGVKAMRQMTGRFHAPPSSLRHQVA